MRSVVLVLLLTMVFCGCATKQSVWVKPDYNEPQFRQDVYRCQQEAATYASSARGVSGTHASQNLLATALVGEKEVNYQMRFNECMGLAGYRLEQK